MSRSRDGGSSRSCPIPEDSGERNMGSIKKAFDLTGKTALVTGGSRGLGLQIAEALGEQGATLILSSRKADDLKRAQEHLASLSVKADWIAADNGKESDIQRLADEA